VTSTVSAVSGCWALLSLTHSIHDHDHDLMQVSSISTESLVSFSFGIHLVESLDMFLHLQPSFLLIHHLLTVICFGGALLTGKAVGFAALAIVTDVNVIFSKVGLFLTARHTDMFKINSKINIVILITRLSIFAWMIHKSFLFLLPPSVYLGGLLGLLTVYFWNSSEIRKMVGKDIVMKFKGY